MNSKELNDAIRELDGAEFDVKGLENSDKCIPYYGWFWRTVDFGEAITLGYTREEDREEANISFEQLPDFVGFMQNNKWGYPEFTCSLPQTQQIEELLIKAVEKPSNESLQAVYDYIQTLKPKS